MPPATQSSTQQYRPIVIPEEFQDVYEGPSLQGQYAGFISRLLAFLIDISIVLVIVATLAFMLTLFLTFFGLEDTLGNLTATRPTLDLIIRSLTALFSFGFVSFVYNVGSITVTGGLSVGRGLLGVRVVRLDGEPIHLGRSIRRYIGFYLALLPFGLGLLWVIWDDRRQGWHDKFAKTCVIYDWPAYEHGSLMERLRGRWDYMRTSRNRGEELSDTSAG